MRLNSDTLNNFLDEITNEHRELLSKLASGEEESDKDDSTTDTTNNSTTTDNN